MLKKVRSSIEAWGLLVMGTLATVFGIVALTRCVIGPEWRQPAIFGAPPAWFSTALTFLLVLGTGLLLGVVVHLVKTLKDDEEQLAAIYDSTPLIMLLVDSDRRVRKMNKFAERFSGASNNDFANLRQGEALRCLNALNSLNGCGVGPHCGDCAMRRTVLDTLMGGRSHHQVETQQQLLQEGRVRDVTFLLSAVRLNFRGERQVLVTIQDITDRKRAEMALIRTEKLAAAGRLAATVAHEINNPLEAMTNLAYLIRPSITDASGREYLDMMERQLQTITRITKQTLKFHRESGHPAEFDLGGVIGELVEFFAPVARDHGVTLTSRLDTSARVVGFSGEIRQVISNLLLNALEATPEAGRVVVHLYPAREWHDGERQGYCITVADTGRGIDAQHRARLFEPFFTTKGERGTGLGLWVSMGIVNRAGGHLRVWSGRRPGRTGTCFSIFLPAGLPAGVSLSELPKRRRYEAVDANGPAA
jgi:signal transduction histidine kinase